LFNLEIYEIELPMISPWSSEPSVIDAVLELFHTTTRFVEYTDADQGGSEPNRQLPRLAGVLFAAIRERLNWLGRLVSSLFQRKYWISETLRSAVAATEPGTDGERKQLNEKFQQLRPEVLEILRKCLDAGPFSLFPFEP
jgi:nuclear pore complex protein Nup133